MTTTELAETRRQLVALRDAALAAGDTYRFTRAADALDTIDERILAARANA